MELKNARGQSSGIDWAGAALLRSAGAAADINSLTVLTAPVAVAADAADV